MGLLLKGFTIVFFFELVVFTGFLMDLYFTKNLKTEGESKYDLNPEIIEAAWGIGIACFLIFVIFLTSHVSGSSGRGSIFSNISAFILSLLVIILLTTVGGSLTYLTFNEEIDFSSNGERIITIVVVTIFLIYFTCLLFYVIYFNTGSPKLKLLYRIIIAIGFFILGCNFIALKTAGDLGKHNNEIITICIVIFAVEFLIFVSLILVFYFKSKKVKSLLTKKIKEDLEKIKEKLEESERQSTEKTKKKLKEDSNQKKEENKKKEEESEKMKKQLDKLKEQLSKSYKKLKENASKLSERVKAKFRKPDVTENKNKGPIN